MKKKKKKGKISTSSISTLSSRNITRHVCRQALVGVFITRGMALISLGTTRPIIGKANYVMPGRRVIAVHGCLFWGEREGWGCVLFWVRANVTVCLFILFWWLLEFNNYISPPPLVLFERFTT